MESISLSFAAYVQSKKIGGRHLPKATKRQDRLLRMAVLHQEYWEQSVVIDLTCEETDDDHPIQVIHVIDLTTPPPSPRALATMERKKRIAQRRKRYRMENRERIAARDRLYYKQNRVRIRARENAYRRRKRLERCLLSTTTTHESLQSPR
ncbi:hypothetical protein LEN26_006376 [Aphanomyces euteiches]|nr:hypothetical protein AeMF1_003219 [Aphanomyces euteiches]KAH9135684.1 hypothetical protein LEN26_006376 [Aphanomyces euteiches]KAH9193615.1 hypothetical protein AeNC1_004417 [Aphanomyces euteiches]